ncbi:NADP-dependent oxidoreductase domain-containing protein [Trichoderma chlorosporum]
MSEEKPVALAVGTHTWVPTDEAKLQSIISIMRTHNITVLDTARLYVRDYHSPYKQSQLRAPSHAQPSGGKDTNVFGYRGGESETAIGNLHLGPEFSIDTKAPTGFAPGNAEKIEQSAEQSLAALQTKKVRTYLLHGADETVPFEEQMEAIQKVYEKGSFERFGVSNFSGDQILRLYNIAKSKGYVLPSVFQCSYSLAARHHETELFPTLRKLGFSIQAYSPMAGGFLAKTPEYIEQGLGSWNPDTPTGRFQRALLYKPSYMQMLGEFGELSEKSGLSRASLAYRWVRHHSGLKSHSNDEMIIGASTSDQLADTMKELEGGPLEPWIVQRIDELWELVKSEEVVDNLKASRKVFG